jgi:hypothetical protein
MKTDSILTIGLIGIGVYAVYKLFNSDILKGTEKAFSGVGGSISDISQNTSDLYGNITGAFGSLFQKVEDFIKGTDKVKEAEIVATNAQIKKDLLAKDESQKDISTFETKKTYGSKDTIGYSYDKTSGTLFDSKTGFGYSTATPTKMVASINRSVPTNQTKLFGSAKLINGKIVL